MHVGRYHDLNSGVTCFGCTDKMKWVHPFLVTWFWKQKAKYNNLHCSDGWRGPSDQEKMFNEGKSDKHWPDSKHNRTLADHTPCSEAVDLFMINEDGEGQWNRAFYQLIFNDITKDRLPIRWGGTFILRSGAKDNPHFEMIT